MAEKKARAIVWCNILGILCLAALKTNSERQFYVWKQRLFCAFFFSLWLEFYVCFKLFFIIYLFLILFYGGERANIYYLSVHSVSFSLFLSKKKNQFHVYSFCCIRLNGCVFGEHTSQNVRHDGRAIISVLCARERIFTVFFFVVACLFRLRSIYGLMWSKEAEKERTNRTHELRFVFHFLIFMYVREARVSAQ